jgi:glycosyltransferase involved in cell wall biosynthesis
VSERARPGTALPISVVIPAYNSESFIAAAIASVQAQTRHPAEIVVIDDGSTDATAARAIAAGARVVVQANQGPSAARNTGIREARQPWIAFLDADDAWTPDKLERQWAAHQQCPLAPLLISDYALVDGSSLAAKSLFALMPHYLEAAREPLGKGVVLIRREEMLRVIVRTNVVSTSTLLVDRAWLVQHDLLYAESLPSGPDFLIAEDYEWLLRALRYGDVVVVERSLACYTRHDESRSSSKGRPAYGEIILGELIAQVPGRYIEGAASAFRRARPMNLRRAGLEYLRQSEYARARTVLRQAFAERPSFGGAGLLALAAIGDWRIGRSIIAGARVLWRQRRKYGSAPTIQ